MKKAAATLTLFLAAVPAFAVKPCEELKTEIAAKLDAKGVTGYQLEIVATADVKDQKVIGSCEGGTKNLTYTRDAAAPADHPATKTPAPAKAAAPGQK